MKAQYLHCSFAGSYWIDCDVVEKRKCDMSDTTQLDRVLRKPPKHFGEVGYVITYVDEVDGAITKWVPMDYIKLPEVSEWIGL